MVVAEEVVVDIHWVLVPELWDLAHILVARIGERMGSVELAQFEEPSRKDVLKSPRKDLGLVRIGRMELIVDALVEVETAVLVVREFVTSIENVLVVETTGVFVALVVASMAAAVIEEPQR